MERDPGIQVKLCMSKPSAQVSTCTGLLLHWQLPLVPQEVKGRLLPQDCSKLPHHPGLCQTERRAHAVKDLPPQSPREAT